MERIGKVVGTHDSALLNVQRLIESRLLIQANSGGGKSYAIRKLLEVTHDKCQQIVIDVEGEFHTLRERYDFVLAGKGRECPAEPRSASMLARKVLELGVSIIIDIFELKAHERAQFIRIFLDAMIGAPRSLWHPALVVVDEAHLFAPQVGSAECTSAVIDLMTRGRKRGFCGVLATQRISKLHKDAAAEANNKLIGRSAQDIDMKRAADELGFTTREQQHSLRTLAPGHFWAFGPAISESVTEIAIDKVLTTHPTAGAREVPAPPARKQVQVILAKLADIPKEAEEELRTVDQYRQRVRELEIEVRKKPAPAADDAALKAAEARGFARGTQELKVALKRSEQLASKLKKIAELARDDKFLILDHPNSQKEEQYHSEAVVRTNHDQHQKSREELRENKPRPEFNIEIDLGKLSNPQQRILNELATLKALGIHAPDRAQLGLMCGYTNPRSGGFSEPLKQLQERGLISYPGTSRIAITDLGLDRADADQSIPANSKELQQRLMQKLKGTCAKILNALIEAYPNSMERDLLGSSLGYKNPRSGGFSEPLRSLYLLGLVDYPDRGHVVATKLLFLE
ncbi:MAG: ATP-binding protein [Planctomycetota bacterium]|nr:ATP-binding protein [Planctomycetota bacterium]